MTSILALTLSATVLNAPPPEPPRPALLTQTQRIIEAPVPATPMVSATRAALAPPGDDSLANGALIGGLIAGAASAVVLGYFCHVFNETGDPICVKQVAWRSAVAAGAGALIGAGVDAMFMRKPAIGARIRF